MTLFEYLDNVQKTKSMNNKDIYEALRIIGDLVDNFHAPRKQLYELLHIDSNVFKGSDDYIDPQGSYYIDNKGTKRAIDLSIVKEFAKVLMNTIKHNKDAKALEQVTFYESDTIGVVAKKLQSEE